MDRSDFISNHSIPCKGESMKKKVCIFPKDHTTEFLTPLYDYIRIAFHAEGIGYDISGDDDPLEFIYNEIEDTETIFFLGHGMSACLYASILDNVELFNKDNISLLKGKQLFLLACNSDQFIVKNGLTNAIGFGFLPTSENDVEQTKIYHNLDISMTGVLDIDYFNNALVQCFVKTLSEETMNDFHLFKERLAFNVSKAIADCLINKSTTCYRIVADELYYMYKDMIIT